MENIINQIDKIIRYLVENPYFGLVGFLIGLISLLYAYYIAKRDKRIKNLSYDLVSNNIISGSKKAFPNLEISYGGSKLDNFTITKLRIKNAGTEVIKPTDIAQSDPIRITINPDKAELLDFDILSMSDSNNNFRIIKTDNSTLNVEFDYVEPKDNVAIQILHTGKDSSPILLSGTVIGSQIPFRSSASRTYEMAVSPFQRIVRWMYLTPSRKVVLILSFFIVPIFGVISYSFFTNSNLILSLLCAIPAAVFLGQSLRAIFRRPDPVREELSKDWMRAMLGNAIPNLEQGETIDEKKFDI